MQMTFGQFLTYMEQLPRIRKWEANEDPDAPASKSMTAEEIAEAIADGSMDPAELLRSGPVRSTPLTEEQKRKEEERIKRQLNMTAGQKTFRDRIGR
jgi:hypothetical protein